MALLQVASDKRIRSIFRRSPYAPCESLVDSALRFFIGNDSNTNKTQLRKLASLDPILRLHKRESVCEYVVFKAVPLPFAFI